MIRFEGKQYALEPGETVLECLTRAGVDVPFFCKNGACQTCLLKATDGTPPAPSQAGLKESWKQQGFLLSCVCKPTEPLAIERCDAATAVSSRVLRVEPMTGNVLRVHLERPAGFEFRAGQFVQLERPVDRLMRPYSIASLPSEPTIELHVAQLAGGKMSGWLMEAEGEPVTVRGPFGECFYLDDEPDAPLLLAGTGTGLAPLWGVVRDALTRGHRGTVRLYHGARDRVGLYLWSELLELSEKHPQFKVTGSVLVDTSSAHDATSSSSSSAGQVVARKLDEVVLSEHAALKEHRVYLCGHPDLVRLLKKRIYLAGASLQRIHSDPFLPPAT